MIQHYSRVTHDPGVQRPPFPGSVRNAVKVMYAGAVLDVGRAIIYLATASATKAAVKAKHPHLSASALSTVSDIAVIGGAVIALIAAAMFVWIASSSKNGKNWARITGTALFAFAILGTVYNLTAVITTLNLALIFAEVLIGLVAVTLLWQRDASTWFGFFKRPQL